jgi:3-phenylpropionate/trans-cinnamate dioxygenase ferredoxin reductase subunit
VADRHADHLLIGGGVASAACAHSLRERGAEGSIVLLGRELDPPYHRPPATKEYLRGEASKEDALVQPESWYEEHGVELRTRAGVRSIDTEARTAKLQGGEEISYGTALLATGSLVNRLRLDGSALDGLHYVRALGNADGIRDDAQEAEHVVIVGGSYIGCEVAASLTGDGRKVTVVMLEDEPMQRGFGPQAGAWVRGLLEAHDVEVLGSEQVAAFEGEERVKRVRTEGGRTLKADMVVLGTGVTPDVMLAKAAGLELGDTGGVRCDSCLRTSAESLWAAGDICEYANAAYGRRLRVEHEDVAERQGKTVAANMLGETQEHTAPPYFWSDLADWTTLEYVGVGGEWDQEQVRGSMDGDEGFSVLYTDAGRLVGCLAVGRSHDLDAATEVVEAGGDLSGDAGRALLSD